MSQQVLKIELEWRPALREVTYRLFGAGAWINAGGPVTAITHTHRCDHGDDGIPCGECILVATESLGAVLCHLANSTALTYPVY